MYTLPIVDSASVALLGLCKKYYLCTNVTLPVFQLPNPEFYFSSSFEVGARSLVLSSCLFHARQIGSPVFVTDLSTLIAAHQPMRARQFPPTPNSGKSHYEYLIPRRNRCGLTYWQV
jgi:hypothetical protein